jgi:hypothetical protein
LDESFKETAATKHLIGKSIETAGMGEARARGYYFLSCFLQHRSEQTRSLLDLEKAITAARQSVDCTALIAENRPNLIQRLGQVARGVLARFEVSRQVDDLNQAIASSTEAVYLNTLGNALQRRVEANGMICIRPSTWHMSRSAATEIRSITSPLASAFSVGSHKRAHVAT